jgi:hypothetical protein
MYNNIQEIYFVEYHTKSQNGEYYATGTRKGFWYNLDEASEYAENAPVADDDYWIVRSIQVINDPNKNQLPNC